MGDRANIKFTFGQDRETGQEHDPIYLYTHWHGSELPLMLKEALAAGKGRWGDESYLARICISRIVDMAGDHLSDTGWGLSPYVVDNEYPITECNLIDNTVTVNGTTWPFAEYVTLTDEAIQQVYQDNDEDA